MVDIDLQTSNLLEIFTIRLPNFSYLLNLLSLFDLLIIFISLVASLINQTCLYVIRDADKKNTSESLF